MAAPKTTHQIKDGYAWWDKRTQTLERKKSTVALGACFAARESLVVRAVYPLDSIQLIFGDHSNNCTETSPAQVPVGPSEFNNMCIYDVYGPCSCPHGRCFTVLAQCFTISSWVTSLMAITSCFYIYVRPIPEEGQPELPREGFGYISRQVGVLEPPNYRQCVWYSGDEKDEYFDAMWRAGKAMSLLACGIGGIVMCVLMCTCCVAYQLPTFDAMFWTCMFCFVAQTLTFLAWGSQLCDDYECTWSSGTGMNITAAMLWVWAANMIKSFPEALPPRGRGKRKPVYDENGEDSPYLNPNRGFDDEYDYGEEENWQNDGEYYDDYDDSYYDSSRDLDTGDSQYDDQEYYDQQYDENGEPLPYDDQQGYYDQNDQNQPDGYIGDGSYNDPAYPQNEYATDYEEPDPRAQNDQFAPNEHFKESWRDNAVDDESAYSSSKDSSTNYFQQEEDQRYIENARRSRNDDSFSQID